ncbi:9-cis-epoxycarotenoid dioxygenase [Hordeum vulgare]|nr:9-cis-epoxycarotenoid dioxygenase [Hordeum vulgare]
MEQIVASSSPRPFRSSARAVSSVPHAPSGAARTAAPSLFAPDAEKQAKTVVAAPQAPVLESPPEHNFVGQRSTATALDAVQIAGSHAPLRTVDPAVEIAGNFAALMGKTAPAQALPVPVHAPPTINGMHPRIGASPHFDAVVPHHLLHSDAMVHASLIRNGISGMEPARSLPMFRVAIVELHGHYGIARRALFYARKACYPVLVMASLSAAGILLFTSVTSEDHAWHNIAYETIRISFSSLEACLLVHTKMNDDGGNQELIRDLLMKLVDTLINNKRFWDSVRQTAHSPLDAPKILHLVGNGLPVFSGACQVMSMAYEAGLKFIPEVAERFREARRVSSAEEEQATRAVESGLSVTIRAFSVRWVTFTMSKKAEWFRKIRRVPAGEDQAAAAAMEMQGYGGIETRKQEAEEDV